jgi:xylanolytic transcriptional activator XlnR
VREYYDPLQDHRSQTPAAPTHDQQDLATGFPNDNAAIALDLATPALNTAGLDEAYTDPPRAALSEDGLDHFVPDRGEQAHPRRPYKVLEPLLPLVEGIVGMEESCELLEFYFAQPGSSLFRSASPYVLTHVLRKRSLLHPLRPRHTTPALLCTILWVSAQTADIPLLLPPGERTRVCEALRKLSIRLIRKRDRDYWERLPDGQLVESDSGACDQRLGMPAGSDPPTQSIDDVLTFILICIVVSGGDFKTDCQAWWNKAIRLMYKMGLNRKDSTCEESGAATCVSPSCSCRKPNTPSLSLETIEADEECRRVFWLLFCLDRHLALSYNSAMCIGDEECQVYTPLSEEVWNSFESAPSELLSNRSYGPPTLVTGIGLFEWFLPLMTILGDVIQVHRHRLHQRFGSLDDAAAVALIEVSLQDCAKSINEVESRYETEGLDGTIPASAFLSPSSGHQETPMSQPFDTAYSSRPRGRAQAQLVTAYGTFILHVLHVLLHGKWDAVSMLDNDDGWITSVPFMKCAAHAISASEAVSQILRCDPELTFMPYLFGIYLLHGSFILLLFADRMPQLGPNESVERACETIVRAHEVCVVTLSTEFQVCPPVLAPSGQRF